MKYSPRARLALAPILGLALSSLALAQTAPQKPAGKPAATKPAAGATTTPPRSTAPSSAPAAKSPARDSGAERLDGIAAVVNDEIVLQSDVEEQLYALVRTNGLRPDSAMADTLRHQILDQLINEKLIVAEAKRQGMTVSDAEVYKQADAEIRKAKEQFGGEAAFRAQLQQENLTEEKLREKYATDLRRSMLSDQMKQRQLPRKPVPKAEAEAYFQAHPGEFPKRPAEVRLSVIQIPIMPDSVALAAGRAKILAARKRILAGEKFAKVAAEVSEDPGSAKAGGDLGFFGRGMMEPAVENAAFTLKLGEVSEPVRSPYGWHLVEAIERDTMKTTAGKDSLDATGKPALEAHARHILVRVEMNDADAERARQVAERVRGEAAKGTNFGTLVRRYSKYEGQQGDDGDVGFVSLGSLQPQIRAGLDSLEVGQVSEPLPNQIGFNIFKITDRRPDRAYTLDEIRDQLPEYVEQLKLRTRYEEWVKTLRAKAHIDIRGA